MYERNSVYCKKASLSHVCFGTYDTGDSHDNGKSINQVTNPSPSMITKYLVHKEPEVQLRPSIGTIAQTAIIPRTDLGTFLHFLDNHFCLAIWTSAKRRTAKRLLTMLIPEGIKSRQIGRASCRER